MPVKNLLSKTPIGAMDKRVEIRSASTSDNEYGEQTLTWATLATVWAEVTYPARGNSEGEDAGQVKVFQTIVFTIRHRTGIDEKMRILYDSREYDIVNITPTERKGHLKIETTLRK